MFRRLQNRSGLGTCYVGASRNNAREMAALVRLPERVYGVFGIAIGWPDESQEPGIKPRLCQKAVLHCEVYDTNQTKAIESYKCGGKAGRKPWSEYTAEWLATDSLDGRQHLRQFLDDQGFVLK